MTVKEFIPYLSHPEEVLLSWSGDLVNFNYHSEIECEVWGNYVVRKICATADAKFELVLAALPIKKEEPV